MAELDEPVKGANRQTMGLSDAINEIGYGPFQLKIGLLTGLAEIANGAQQLSVSFLVHFLGNLFHLTTHGKALIGTVAGLGMFIGSIFWGRVSDIKGRRFAFSGSLLMSGTFGLLCAASPSFAVFLVFRALLSIGIGGNVPLAFTIFSEFSPLQNRGAYLTMLEAWWATGAVISCLLAWGTLPTYGWQWFVLESSLPAFLLGWAVYFMPESPRYHVVKGEIEMAEATLKEMAVANNRPDKANVRISEFSKPETSFQPTFGSLFAPNYRWKTLPLFLLYFLLSFGCGVFVWLPTLLQEKKFEVMSMYRSMVIMAMSQIPGVLMSAFVVEAVGRKAALVLFFGGGATSMVMFAFSEGQVVTIAASIFMEFFLAGSNGALSAYTTEAFPTSLRSTGMGACSSISRLSSIVNPTIWATLLTFSDRLAVLTGSAALIVGALVVLLLSETRNVNLEDHVKEK